MRLIFFSVLVSVSKQNYKRFIARDVNNPNILMFLRSLIGQYYYFSFQKM